MAAPSETATFSGPINSQHQAGPAVAVSQPPATAHSSTSNRASVDDRHGYGHALPTQDYGTAYQSTHAGHHTTYDENPQSNYPGSWSQSSPKTPPKETSSTNNGGANSPSNSSTPTPDTGNANAPSSNRRLAHILSEQKRRENINSGFEDLKNVVPGCRGSADSKAVILRKAVHYIHGLQTELANIRHNVAASGPSSSAYSMHPPSYSHHVSPPTHHLHPHQPHQHHQQPPLAPPPPPHHSYPQHPSQHAYMRYQDTPSAIPAKRSLEEEQYARTSQQEWNARSSHYAAPPQAQYYDERSHYAVQPPPPPSIKLAPLVGHPNVDQLDEASHKREPSDAA